MAITIFQWITNGGSGREERDYDELWSSLINKHQEFTNLSMQLSFKADYKNWYQEHESWCFHTCLSKNGDNGIAIIVGKFGEMKGAVQCL